MAHEEEGEVSYPKIDFQEEKIGVEEVDEEIRKSERSIGENGSHM